VVFGGPRADLHRRIDDESVAIDENSVLVLEQVGPCGAGMPSGASSPGKKHRTPV